MKKSESCTNRLPREVSQIKDLEVMCNYRRLKFIRRFNNFPTLNTEDVAQHSYFTTILAMTMADEYNVFIRESNKKVADHNLTVHPYDVESAQNPQDEVNVGLVMRYALFHDIEEAFTSDIPWNVKHHNSAVNTLITGVAQSKLQNIYENCSEVFRYQMQAKLDAKNGLEGKFVAIADMLECAWNCYQENQMGNPYLDNLKNKALDVISSNPFSKTLEKVSPFFRSMCGLLREDIQYLGADELNLD